MLIILLRNHKLTLKEVRNFIPVHYKTLLRWWKYYKEGGFREIIRMESRRIQREINRETRNRAYRRIKKRII